MEDKIFKKLGVANGYIVSFIVALVLMVLIPNISSFGLIGYIFVYDFENAGMIFDINSSMSYVLEVAVYISQTVGYVVLIGIFIILFKKMFIADFKSFKDKLLKNILIIVIGAILMFGATYLVEWILNICNVPTSSENQDTIIGVLSSPMVGYMVICAVILAPIVEEMIFRKLLFGTLEEKAKWPKFVVIIISTLIFSLIHISGELTAAFLDPSKWIFVLAIVSYIPLSLVLSLGYSLSKNNIYVSMALHFINNLLSVILIFI